MQSLNFTKSSITSLPFALDGRLKYQDSEINNLFLIVGKKTKTYYLDRKFRGRVKRIKIGDANSLNPAIARNKARELLGLLSQGIDPTTTKITAKSKTLGEVWGHFKLRRPLKPGTIKDYESRLSREFDDWLAHPIAGITGDMVALRHAKIGQRDHAYANGCMRVLRSIVNFAEAEYVDEKGQSIIKVNPVRKLSKTKAWFPAVRRQSDIPASRLPEWFDAVRNLQSDVARDYLMLVALTGLRREEAARLKWSDVNLKERTLTIRDTKNIRHSGVPHVIPMSTQLFNILELRFQNKQAGDDWVFSGKDGKPANGYWKHVLKLQKITGIEFSIHDLRRTFATTAESLDLPYYVLKRLLNHKMTSDVTAGYIITSIDRLREPVQRIADRMLGGITHIE